MGNPPADGPTGPINDAASSAGSVADPTEPIPTAAAPPDHGQPAETSPFETIQPGYHASYPEDTVMSPPPAPPSGLKRAWAKATASTASRVATIGGIALASFVVVFLVAGLAFGLARHERDDGFIGRDDARAGSVAGSTDANGGDRADPNSGLGGMSPDGDRGLDRDGDDDHQLGDQPVPGLMQALHGEFVGGSPRMTYLFQRGQVTKASTTSVTVQSTDGFSGIYAVDSQTRTNLASVPNTGTDVAVLAIKDGAKAVMVTTTRARFGYGD
ncbi:MAG: hypothetical protein ACK5MP_04425 [Nostocoides sp.]